MESFVKKIKDRLDAELALVNPEMSPVKGHNQRVKLIINAISDLKAYLLKHPFKRTADEIHYFKQVAPLFYQPYFYYTKLYNFELTRITSDKEAMLALIGEELKMMRVFYTKHEEFCRYIYMDSTFLDEQLFTRGVPENWILDEAALVMDDHFSLASYRLTWLKTYEVYGQYLLEEKLNAENKPASENIQRPGRTYSWKANDTDLVELIYGLWGTGAIEVDGRKMGIKDLTQMCKDFFNIELGNVYDTHIHNLSRKKDKVPFLNSMMQSIMTKA